ncbi:VCBS repeat-containing protein [Pontixanthobacter gangjinensis]|uniref:ASPIC/UnbV domain-containing protein n=1 Tax=Christiangramia aestuarii TaxID=1028746 RepID=A0A7K1LP16_9FLAO|nr:VCBS repeat-containing protein [Christiangramia aestuarii]MUP42554.1 hypothetical protein [Christiangramia aestuarii]
MNRISFLYFITAFQVLVSCSSDSKKDDERVENYLFERLETESTGIDFENNLTETDSMNILNYLYYYNGGGVAIGDINNDELPDIFFTSNQESNRLYLNQGDFRFEDITEKAGVAGKSDWNTGVVMADVNADGYLDIYVLAVSGIRGLHGRNELYINNTDGTFREAASEYGIALENYGTSAAFFDFDNDGDLDLYVLNHAVHTDDSFGPVEIRDRRTEASGDKLFEFRDGKFHNISEKAGIYGGPNAYGLGLATADFNNDGFTDIYVSNDFHEDDYLYINNGNGTFNETLKDKMSQVSRFSMGNDVADINHDGYPDLLSLDMLPEDETALKSSVGDEEAKILNLRMKYGYHRQFSRNMLQLNNFGENFQEIALLSGIGATDWSWSALFADYDMDGEKDIFISNGIEKRPNDLDYIKYVSNNQILKNKQNSEFIDYEALKIMPDGRVPNYFFKGTKDLAFKDVSGEWIAPLNTSSNGSAYADLDNDGDLDLVTNDLNAKAGIYENLGRSGNTYLKLELNYSKENKYGIGTKVYSYHQDTLQYDQLFTSKGFQSSSEPIIHFGYGQNEQIDSLIVVWPDRSVDKYFDLKTNQSLSFSPTKNTRPDELIGATKINRNILEKKDSIPGFNYTHKENSYDDFDRQKLIPYRVSDKTPSAAIGDIDNDGKDDIFIGNSRGSTARIFIQANNELNEAQFPFLKDTRTLEITDVEIADFNGDGKNDIFYVTGGSEFDGQVEVLKDACWISDGDGWKKMKLPEFFSNASVIRSADIDNDGDLDIFIGGYSVAGDFGKIPESFLLENKGQEFELVQNTQLRNPGMITDALWLDLDHDEYPELLLVGEWMSPRIFKNTKGVLDEDDTQEFKDLEGLWQSMAPFDIDHDGDFDILLGNWGLNSKFKASASSPLKMFYGDIDGNGSTETILTHEKEGKYYTYAGLDELASQMNYLKKKFPDYSKFAGKDVQEIFGDGLDQMSVLEVNTLASGYLKNEDGKFRFIPFNKNLQFAPINAILVTDKVDGEEVALLSGNYFGVSPFHGAYAAFSGAMIFSENDIRLGPEIGLDLSGKAIREMELIELGNQSFLIGLANNDKAELYKVLK